MARPATTPAQRAASVNTAADALPQTIARAVRVSMEHGWSHPDALAAWAVVETHGATIHRQSRLLAGKSKGG